MTGDDEKNAKVMVPAPDGDGELHSLFSCGGTVLTAKEDDVPLTTNRAYFAVRGDGLELTAEECREFAGMFRTAADALENYHDVRMPVDD